MRKLLTYIFMLCSLSAFAQPTIWGGGKMLVTQGDTSAIQSVGSVRAWIAANLKAFVATQDAVASVGSGSGTAAGNVATITGAAGGATSANSGSVTGGVGGGVVVTGGAGGAITGTPGTGTGGAGGQISLTAGDGGAGTTFGGNGGNANIQAGVGGNGTTPGTGGYAALKAGNGSSSGNSSGGNVFLVGGAKTGSGSDGDIYLGVSPSLTSRGKVKVGGSTPPTAMVSVGEEGTTSGTISVAGSTSGTITIQPAAAAGTYTLTLPTTDGGASEFLQTDGSGVLSWAASSGSVATDAIWDAAGDIVQGTGANTSARLAIGTANQQLRVNAGATALEYFTPSAGSGDIVNGGNSTGATVTIGTNDANALNLETNNVARVAITGGASTGGALTLTDVTSNTSTVEDAVTVQTNSSGTAAAGFGGAIKFQGESSTTNSQDMARISSFWTTATHSSRVSALTFSTLTGAGSLTERMRIAGDGKVGIGGIPSYTLDLTSAYSTNLPTFRTGGFVIQPYSLNNGFLSDNAYYNGSSWTRIATGYVTGFQFYNGQLAVSSTNTGTGNFTQTIQVKSDYNGNFCLGADVNAANNVFTGATFIHNSAGKTGLGTTSPTAILHLKAGTASANTAPLKFTSGTNLTAAEAGAMEYDGTELYFSPSTTRYVVDKGLRGSATLDFASTAAGAIADLTITVTGASDGDVVSLGVPNASITATATYTAWVSATNTVTVRFSPKATEDPASGTFKVLVSK